jgi:hypothetical protein
VRVEIVAASPVHIGTIASRMREADRRECEAMGRTPKDALRSGLRNSLWTLTAIVDGRPEAMFGVVPRSMVESAGIAWFLGTDRIYGCGRSMLTKGREVIALMRRTFSTLENVVSADNDRAIRLLKRWGFSVGDEVSVYGGVAFLPFRMMS